MSRGGAVTRRSRSGRPGCRRSRRSAGPRSAAGRPRSGARPRARAARARARRAGRNRRRRQSRCGDHVVERDLADATPSRPAGLGQAEPDDEPVGPGLEPVGVSQARQLAPDGHERLLDRVVGLVRVVDDPVGGHVQARRRRPRECLVGVAVACLRLFDQPPIHQRRTSVVRPVWTSHPIRGPLRAGYSIWPGRAARAVDSGARPVGQVAGLDGSDAAWVGSIRCHGPDGRIGLRMIADARSGLG